jgi:hypothetical protein
MPITYTPIASTTLTSDSTSVTFNSIPQTFTDLVIVMSVGKGISYTTGLQFNGVTTLTYSRTRLSGDGTTASSARNTTAQAFQYIPLGSFGNGTTLGTENIVAHLLNYSNTTTFKTTLSRSNAVSSGLDASVGLWQSTAAINLIRIAPDVDTPARTSFLTGSTFTLYGIKAA